MSNKRVGAIKNRQIKEELKEEIAPGLGTPLFTRIPSL